MHYQRTRLANLNKLRGGHDQSEGLVTGNCCLGGSGALVASSEPSLFAVPHLRIPQERSRHDSVKHLQAVVGTKPFEAILCAILSMLFLLDLLISIAKRNIIGRQEIVKLQTSPLSAH